MREIPKKNYFILGAMTVFVVALVFGLMSLYNSNNKNEYKPVVKDVINEIKYDDLENYVLENPNALLYINDSEYKNKKVEKMFKDIIVDNNLQQSVVYIEKTEQVKKEYDLKSETPIFVLYKDGKVKEILAQKSYSKDTIIDFLRRNEIIEND